MKLIDLNPHWARSSVWIDPATSIIYQLEDRHGMGITFDCPCCLGTDRATRLGVFFSNPLDGLPPGQGVGNLWERAGDDFSNLTLTPSVDASNSGHWHGFISSGEVR